MDVALNLGAQLGGVLPKEAAPEIGATALDRRSEGYEGAAKQDGAAKEFLAALLDQSAAAKDQAVDNTFTFNDTQTPFFKLQFGSVATLTNDSVDSKSIEPQPEVPTLFIFDESEGVQRQFQDQASAAFVIDIANDGPDALQSGQPASVLIGDVKTEPHEPLSGATASAVTDDASIELPGLQPGGSVLPVNGDDKNKPSKPQSSASAPLTAGDVATVEYEPQTRMPAPTVLDDAEDEVLPIGDNSQAKRSQQIESRVNSRTIADDPISPRRSAQPGAKAAIVQGAEILPLQKSQPTSFGGVQQLAAPDAEKAVVEDVRIPGKQTQPSATLNDPSRVVQSRQASPYLSTPTDHAAAQVLITNNGEGVSGDLDLDLAVDFTSGRRLVGQAASVPQTLASPTTTHAPVVGATAQVIAAIKANRRSDTIEIRLDPPELGRVKIDFTMETMDSVKAILSAERAETLDHMRRNIGELAGQLKDAGFKSVEFEFTQNSGHEFSNTNAAPETPGKDGDDSPSLGQEDIVYLSMRSDAQLDLLA